MNKCRTPDSKLLARTGVFLGLILLIATEAGQADNSIRDSDLPVDVRVFEVAPVQRVAAILAPNAQTPASPAALDAATLDRLLRQLAVSKDPGSVPGSPSQDVRTIMLSSQQPFIEGQAMLTLVRPATVHPESAIRFDEEMNGSAGIKLMVHQGDIYLLDFAVRSLGSGSYTVETAGGSEQFADTAGNREHILLALSASSSGWTTVRINRQGSGYFLYSAAVTAVN